MLRQMLKERFHVAVHPGTKQVSGYILVVAKDGSKLKPAKLATIQQGHKAGQPFSNSLLPGYIRGRSVNLNGIAALLSAQADAPVADHTDISGVFDIYLHFASGDNTESDWPSFPIAVEQQLGLKLQPQKIIVNTLMIDHVDKDPTPNLSRQNICVKLPLAASTSPARAPSQPLPSAHTSRVALRAFRVR